MFFEIPSSQPQFYDIDAEMLKKRNSQSSCNDIGLSNHNLSYMNRNLRCGLFGCDRALVGILILVKKVTHLEKIENLVHSVELVIELDIDVHEWKEENQLLGYATLI